MCACVHMHVAAIPQGTGQAAGRACGFKDPVPWHTHTHTSTRKHTSGHSPMRDAHVPTAEQGQQGCPGNPSAQVQSCGTSTQGSY